MSPNLGAPLPDEVQRLASELRLTATVARWLLQSSQRDAAEWGRFLDPKLSELSPPESMVGRQLAAERLARAVRDRERIVVFGDYDCDGITATAILTEALRLLGADVQPELANRFAGGYGVSGAASRRIQAFQPRLLVTCDCGSSDHESLAELGALGVDVVVIDHHLVPERPLPALAFLNPHRPECGFGYKGLASCGLALSVVAAVRKELGVDLDVRRWLDLVAIGTIADVAPLDGDNRALVRAGLARLARTERPGLRALIDGMNLSCDGPLTSRDVAFRIAPQLNAPGRMGAPTLALELLLASDESRAQSLAEELREVTARRRQEQDEILTQAREDIAASGAEHASAIVVGRVGWNPGVVGIVAGRLADELRRPVAVIGFDEISGRGSVRGPAGSRLFDALSAAASELVRYGGHQAAAGFELTLERLPAFRAAFVGAVTAQGTQPAAQAPESHVELASGDTPLAVLTDLDRLEPCGADNPRPRLRVLGRVLEARIVGSGHLKLRLGLGRHEIECFGANLGERAPELGQSVRVSGDLRRNSYRGVTRAELFLESLEPGG